jgi:hypothetical protein
VPQPRPAVARGASLATGHLRQCSVPLAATTREKGGLQTTSVQSAWRRRRRRGPE